MNMRRMKRWRSEAHTFKFYGKNHFNNYLYQIDVIFIEEFSMNRSAQSDCRKGEGVRSFFDLFLSRKYYVNVLFLILGYFLDIYLKLFFNNSRPFEKKKKILDPLLSKIQSLTETFFLSYPPLSYNAIPNCGYDSTYITDTQASFLSLCTRRWISP